MLKWHECRAPRPERVCSPDVLSRQYQSDPVEALRAWPDDVGVCDDGSGRGEVSDEGIPVGLVEGGFVLDLVGLSRNGAPGEIDAAARSNDGQEDRRRGRGRGDVEAEDGAGTAVRASERGGA